jgi:hypothetical protein
VREWLSTATAAASADVRSSDWLCAFGNERRNVAASGSVPFLRPNWVFSLTGSDRQDSRVAEWEDEQIERLVEPMAVASFPIAASGQVVVRDFDGIRSLDAISGKTFWRRISPLSLSQLCAQVDDAYRTGDMALENSFVGNATLGTLSSDGRHVYALEYVPFPFKKACSGGSGAGASRGAVEPSDRPAARELRCGGSGS